jgi:hypothetical protein
MHRVSMALVFGCLVTSHLMAQRTNDMRGGVQQNPDGGVCFPAPFYQYCNYDYNYYYAMDASRVLSSTFWSGVRESDPPQPSRTNQSEVPPRPPPPVTSVLHEYNWPEQANTSATFSIVTTSGTLYLATMVWVEGGNVHFNLADGGVRQIPLSSVSRSLTETANAKKNLNLRLQWTQAVTPNIQAVSEEQVRSASRLF